MPTTIHVSQNVEGALRNWRASHWRDVVMNAETGRYLTPDEVKRWFLDLHRKGVRLIPLSSECEGHDPMTGCPGHESPG